MGCEATFNFRKLSQSTQVDLGNTLSEAIKSETINISAIIIIMVIITVSYHHYNYKICKVQLSKNLLFLGKCFKVYLW